MAFKKGSTTPRAYKAPKGHTSEERGNVTTSAPVNNQRTAQAVQQMLQSLGRDDMPNVTIAAPKRGR